MRSSRHAACMLAIGAVVFGVLLLVLWAPAATAGPAAEPAGQAAAQAVTPSPAVYLPLAANQPASQPTSTITPGEWKPAAGGWEGTNEQGRVLTFTVAANQVLVAALRLNVQHEGTCGTIEVAHDFAPFAIDSRSFAAKAGDSQIAGVFSSPTTASGVYTSVVQIYAPVRCTSTHTGTWTASFGAGQSTPTATIPGQATSQPPATNTATSTPNTTATAAPTSTPSPTASATAVAPQDGLWTGINAQGRPVTMTVSANGTLVSLFVTDVHFDNVCGAVVDVTQSYVNAPIVGGRFAVVSGENELQGEFTSSTTALGTFKSTVRFFPPNPCKVTYDGSWAAATVPAKRE